MTQKQQDKADELGYTYFGLISICGPGDPRIWKDKNGNTLDQTELVKILDDSHAKFIMDNWQKVEAETHWLQNARLVRCIAHIRKNETGEVRKYETSEVLDDEKEYPSVFNWEENNFSCDCNRELFFERSIGNEIEIEECSHGRFSVNLENPMTGEIYYREFESL